MIRGVKAAAPVDGSEPAKKRAPQVRKFQFFIPTDLTGNISTPEGKKAFTEALHVFTSAPDVINFMDSDKFNEHAYVRVVYIPPVRGGDKDEADESEATEG